MVVFVSRVEENDRQQSVSLRIIFIKKSHLGSSTNRQIAKNTRGLSRGFLPPLLRTIEIDI